MYNLVATMDYSLEVVYNSSSGEWREKSGAGGEAAKANQGQIHVASQPSQSILYQNHHCTGGTLMILIDYHDLDQELMTKLVMADTRSENAEMDIGRLNVRIDKVTLSMRILGPWLVNAKMQLRW